MLKFKDANTELPYVYTVIIYIFYFFVSANVSGCSLMSEFSFAISIRNRPWSHLMYYYLFYAKSVNFISPFNFVFLYIDYDVLSIRISSAIARMFSILFWRMHLNIDYFTACQLHQTIYVICCWNSVFCFFPSIGSVYLMSDKPFNAHIKRWKVNPYIIAMFVKYLNK